jgi:hypothetical protein
MQCSQLLPVLLLTYIKVAVYYTDTSSVFLENLILLNLHIIIVYCFHIEDLHEFGVPQSL